MAYNRIQAGRLLTAAELLVFEASLGESLSSMTTTRLGVLIKRARNMRDKAQDLLRRQRVATRSRTGSKGGTTGLANERTAQKVQALGEALTRLEKRLAQLDAATERAASTKLRARVVSNQPAAGGTGKAARPSASRTDPETAAKPTNPASPAARRSVGKAVPQISLQRAVKTAVAATQATQKQAAGHVPERSAKAPTTAPRSAGTGVPPGNSGSPASDMVQQRKFTGSQAIQAHVGASGRRSQARRDKR